MRPNVGMLDRIARVIIGLLLVAYAIPIGFPSTGWNWVGWIGIVPLLTAIVGVCPAYGLLGISTCSHKPAHH
jgi:Inner membrane protein YgaP-like, transmembrane domain